jgi:Flp pilus assembly protein TadD
MGQIGAVEGKLSGLLRDAGEDGVEICEAFAQGYCINLQFEAALMLLEAWQTDFPQDYRPHLRRGRIFLEGNLKSSRAEDALREAVRLAPENAEVHRELGKALLTLRKLDEAEEHLRTALELNPGDELALLTLATTLHDRGDVEGARETARQLLKVNPKNDAGQVFLADLLIAAGEFDEAIQVLTPLVEQWPEDLKARYGLAKALQQSGRKEEAARHFQEYARLLESAEHMHNVHRQLESDLHNVELRYELGRLRLMHENHAEGAAWLQSVLLQNPDHQGAHQALAEYYAKIGDTQRERQHRQRLVQLQNSQEAPAQTNPLTRSESLP